jgi:hypothetical protein
LLDIIASLSPRDQEDVKNLVTTSATSSSTVAALPAPLVSTECRADSAADRGRKSALVRTGSEPDTKRRKTEEETTLKIIKIQSKVFKSKTSHNRTTQPEPSRKHTPMRPTVTITLQGPRRRQVDYASSRPFVGFDTHFHPDRMMQRTGTDSLDAALASLPASDNFQLRKAVCIYCFPKSYPDVRRRVQLRKDARLLFAYGWHPKAVLGHQDEYVLEDLDTLLGSKDCVAMGEVGLDYSQEQPSHSAQLNLLRKLLKIT